MAKKLTQRRKGAKALRKILFFFAPLREHYLNDTLFAFADLD